MRLDWQVSDVTDHKDELVDEAIFREIKQVNLTRQMDFTPIQKFTILPTDFSIKGGELGMFYQGFVVYQ